MSKRWMRLVIGIGVLGSLPAAYFGVPGLRAVVDRSVMKLVIGSTGDTRTYWCPMDPDIVRKGPGMCPV